jgi:hypothetical protein
MTENTKTSDRAITLLKEALHIRQNGQYAPGGKENWHEWDLQAEYYLRGLIGETQNAEREFKTITICGSMRYYRLMILAAESYTADGYIVLMPFVAIQRERQSDSETKKMLDRMHFTKIDMSDAIVVIGAHRGESTTREIEYARASGKKIIELSDVAMVKENS